ncbi:MAG: hypothetical protein KC561_05235 [Myxococcales bacterium]|nr:hypothetical protein [Myxococcales bacterium]
MTTLRTRRRAASTVYLGGALALALIGCGEENPSNGEPQGNQTDLSTDLSVDTSDTQTSTLGCSEPVGAFSLGTISLGDDGLSEPFTFEIPSCARSFSLEIDGEDGPQFALQRLEAPSGTVLVDADTEADDPLAQFMVPVFRGQLYSLNPVSGAQGVAVALVPNNPATTFETGEWVAQIAALELLGNSAEPYSGDVQVQVQYKVVDTTDEGIIDVNYYFSGASNLNAANADSSDYFQAAVTRLREIYGVAGVSIGEVRYFDIPATFRVIESIDGPGNEMGEMFRLGANGPPGLNFFMIDRFDIPGGFGSGIGGISGGIPGPVLNPGTVRSGVAVSQTLAATSSDLAHVMGHEGGHYLGLFHTVEFFGKEDPLPDTPNGNDRNNLMYPTVGGDSSLTAEQAAVFHGNPGIELDAEDSQ